MKQPKILLLGGSMQQVVAITTAKAMGYHTVLCDYLSDNPGQHEADKYYNVSTTDVEAVYRVAKAEGVGGILAYASDPAALPAAIVAERLGLPTNPAKAVETLGVKHRFRDFLSSHGFACPKHFAFDAATPIEEVSNAISDFRFPVVVKPTDSSGSKGVSTIHNTQSLARAISHADAYSRNKTLIAEEYIQRGFQAVIGGDIFVCDGQIVLYGEMACLRDDGGKGLIPIEKKKTTALTELQTSNIHTELQRLITALGIRFGEMNLEILLDGDDRPHFLELGPRAGGNMIPLQLSDIFGVDLVRANVAAAMGEQVTLNPKEPQGSYCTYVLHSHRDGVFAAVQFSGHIAPHVYRKVIYKQPGDAVETFDGAGKALGIVFLHFDNEHDMDTFCDNPDKHISIILNPQL